LNFGQTIWDKAIGKVLGTTLELGEYLATDMNQE
jgi:hypothetical protein